MQHACSLELPQASHMRVDVQAREKLKAQGVDMIAVVSMDTPFAMHAWANQLGVTEDFLFLSDVSGQLAKSLGTTFQAGPLGLRPTRYGAFHHFKSVSPSPPDRPTCLLPAPPHPRLFTWSSVQPNCCSFCIAHLGIGHSYA